MSGTPSTCHVHAGSEGCSETIFDGNIYDSLASVYECISSLKWQQRPSDDFILCICYVRQMRSDWSLISYLARGSLRMVHGDFDP